MAHWLDKASDLIRSDEVNLRKLAELAGADPTTFYRGADLSRADLSGQDLRGLDFSHANLNGAVFDDLTRIDPEFYPYDNSDPIIKRIRISNDLISAVYTYQGEVNYAYTGAALRSLIETAHRHSILPIDSFWLKLINDNRSFRKAVDSSQPGSYFHRINIRRGVFLLIRRLQKRFPVHHDAYSAAILVGLLARKMTNQRKDYSNLTLTALYPKRTG